MFLQKQRDKRIKSMKCPKVKVLLAAYNGREYIEEQLQSLYVQEKVEVDIWVRDDGSTDGTIEILNAWQSEGKLRWYSGERLGSAYSFMQLVHDSDLECEYYAFCDQDDYWMPDKLITAITMLNSAEDGTNERECLYYSAVKLVDADLKPIESYYKKKYRIESFGGSLITTFASGMTFVWNRSLMAKLQLYMPQYMIMHDNWVYVVCLALGGKVIYDENPHVLYRQHNNNVIGNIEKQKMSKVGLIKYRIKKFWKKDYDIFALPNELIRGYWDVIPKENREVLTQFQRRDKFKLIMNKSISTGYWVLDLQFIRRLWI